MSAKNRSLVSAEKERMWAVFSPVMFFLRCGTRIKRVYPKYRNADP